ncbi:MAG TPA: VWA domain-containing protein, partial [Dehalococcoidales bacterium]|nr:VWA domain-containing protein [Dehalococcoidales bacterium]
MRRSYVLRVIPLLLLVAVLVSFMLPGKAFGWSAVVGNNTHQAIDSAAYSILSNDPAFSNIKFPQLDPIINNDWVSPVTQNGTGPDVLGSSNCGDHYYNPRLESVQAKAGGGPDALFIQFSNLIGSYKTGNSNMAAKSASWAAHYIADMTVPYHSQGTYRSDIMKIYNAAGGDNAKAVPLPSYITGPMNLSTSVLNHPNDFKKEIQAWLTATKNYTDTEDWFDPWYWDGRVNAKIFSSHIVYEGATLAVPGSFSAMVLDGDLSGGAVKQYSPLWTNQVPIFDKDSMEARQEALIRDFAKKTATQSQKITDAVNGQVSAATPYLVTAIEGVATVWRASFTALTPIMSVSIPDKSQPQKLKITGSVTNTAGETAKNVQFKVTVTGGTLKSKVDNPGEILGGRYTSFSWDVEAAQLGYCSVKLEVIGQYTETPDMEYATTTVTAPGVLSVTSKTTTAKLDYSIVFCLDNSYSMNGQPIIDAMNAGVAAVGAAPYGSVEMALYFFGQNGCDPPFRVLDFTLDHDSVKAAIQTAQAKGNTPLAAMITTAGQYIQSSSRGQEGTIILLTDGIETCGGDPVAAARALNPNLNLKTKTSLFSRPVYAATNIPIKLQVVGFNIAAASGTETLLKQIAQAGNGSYYPASNIQQLTKALNQAVKEATGGSFKFHTWWFIAGGIVILLIIIISLARRGKRTPAPATIQAATTNTASPPIPSQAVNVSTQALFCPNCGLRIMQGASFCTGCGKPLVPSGP